MHNVLVILMSQDPLQKRTFEDQVGLVLEERGIGAEAGYRIIPQDEHINEDFIRSCIVDSKSDAILVNKIMAVTKETSVLPGYIYTNIDHNVGFSRYYSRNYRTQQYIPPATIETEHVYVDSRLYRCDTDGLIWQLQTKIVNVKPFEDVVDKLGEIIVKDLSRNDLL